MAEGHRLDEIEHYQAVLAKDPNSRAFAQLADAYRRQGQLADAIAVCDRGLQRYPSYVGARMVLARALVERGDLARAEAEFRHILDQTPDNIPAHRALGDLLRGQGRAAEALAVYEGLLDLTPFDREVGDLVEGLRVSPPPAPAHAAAPAAPREGQPGEAAPQVPLFDLTEADAAPELPLGPPVGVPEVEAAAPQPVLATETLADLYVQQGFVDEARAIYEELLRLEPARADLRAKLASLAPPPPPAAPAEEAVAEPVAVAAPTPAAEPVAVAASPPDADAPGGDDVVEVLRAWLTAAQELRVERGRR